MRAPDRALIWRRHDFSESSRLVTLLSRDHGRITALAKGAHRAKSPFLGRLDQLNLVIPRFTAQRGDQLAVLRDVKLLHEPRGLRSLPRFRAAAHIGQVFDRAFPEGVADPALFDLLCGALQLVERCPLTGLASTLAGIELAFLAHLGALPDLEGCSTCGARDDRLMLDLRGEGLGCARHRPQRGRIVRREDLAGLRRFRHSRGRDWPGMAPPNGSAIAALGTWIEASTESGTPSRAGVYRALTALRASRPSASGAEGQRPFP